MAVEQFAQVSRAERYGDGRVEQGVLVQMRQVPAARDGCGGGGQHLHEPARIRARHGVFAKQAFLAHDRPYPVGGNARKRGRLGDRVRVGARIPQRNVIPFARLRESADGLARTIPSARPDARLEP